MQMVEHLRRKSDSGFAVPDETIVKSFGAVPLEFDKQDETVDQMRDMVMRRGVI